MSFARRPLNRPKYRGWQSPPGNIKDHSRAHYKGCTRNSEAAGRGQSTGASRTERDRAVGREPRSSDQGLARPVQVSSMSAILGVTSENRDSIHFEHQRVYPLKRVLGSRAMDRGPWIAGQGPGLGETLCGQKVCAFAEYLGCDPQLAQELKTICRIILL